MMIRISNNDGTGRFRASTSVDLPSVRFGRATEEGPWLEGHGDTPDEALRHLLETIGRHYVLSHGVGGK